MSKVITEAVERRPFPVLTRQEMREQLLALPGGVSNMVWKVGSDASSPLEAFQIVIEEINHSGFATWVQSPQSFAGGMNEQVYYNPGIGLVWDGSKISLSGDEGKLLEDLDKPEGIDLSNEAAPGLYLLLKHISELSGVEVFKTHIASPSCSLPVLAGSLPDWQTDIYRALLRGHLNNARRISPRVIVSADDPNPFGVPNLISNFELMFGDRFQNEKLIEQGTDVMRAIHCCGDGDFLGIMSTEAVDAVHFDAWRYPDVLRGRPDVLERYLKGGGLIAWGGVPQKMDILLDLAVILGMDRNSVNINSVKSYLPVADFLTLNFQTAVESVYQRYLIWLSQTEKDAQMDQAQIARQVFISATCGYGSNPLPQLRQASYEIARKVGNLNHQIALT